MFKGCNRNANSVLTNIVLTGFNQNCIIWFQPTLHQLDLNNITSTCFTKWFILEIISLLRYSKSNGKLLNIQCSSKSQTVVQRHHKQSLNDITNCLPATSQTVVYRHHKQSSIGITNWLPTTSKGCVIPTI